MDEIYRILSEEKANQKEQIRIRADRLNEFFPIGFSQNQKIELIENLLKDRHEKNISNLENIIERGVRIMAKRRSTKEQLDELIVKQEEMKAKEKALKKKLALEERKARTKRLIEVGAEVESVYGKPITKEMLPLLRKFLLDQESRGSFFSKALESEDNTKES